MTVKATEAGGQANPDTAAADAAAAAATAAAATAATAAATAAAADTKAAAAGTGTTTDQGAVDAAATAAAKAAEGAPAKYALVIPDEGKAYVDDFTVSGIEAYARENGLTNEDAQTMLNEQVTTLQRADAHFLTQLKADPDYGGDKLAETQRLAKAAIDLMRPEGHPRREAFLRTISRVAGGNNPEFVSFLADLGKRASEDSTGAGSGASKAGTKTAEQVLYGGTAKT